MQWGRFRAALQAIASADTIVVNSWAEWILLEHDFARYLADIRLPPVHVAYSGVDDIYFSGSAERGRHLVGSEPFVLCVGRPEPRKNQIGLVRAMRTVPRRLVLVGEVLPRNEWILEYCRSLLPSLIHISDLEPSSLRDVYAAADAHVLPSFYETTGLATLEALAAGTSAVAGKGPCVHEYFGDSVVLVDPQSPRDIRSGILRALNLPIGGERAKAAQFSWSRTARELIEAYTA
jgi:glycosyltransferase involved in cell wall biosynthesis